MSGREVDERLPEHMWAAHFYVQAEAPTPQEAYRDDRPK
jgi:hypothetical protein